MIKLSVSIYFYGAISALHSYIVHPGNRSRFLRRLRSDLTHSLLKERELVATLKRLKNRLYKVHRRVHVRMGAMGVCVCVCGTCVCVGHVCVCVCVCATLNGHGTHSVHGPPRQLHAHKLPQLILPALGHILTWLNLWQDPGQTACCVFRLLPNFWLSDGLISKYF